MRVGDNPALALVRGLWWLLVHVVFVVVLVTAVLAVLAAGATIVVSRLHASRDRAVTGDHPSRDPNDRSAQP